MDIITLSEYHNGCFCIQDWRYFEIQRPGSVFFSGSVRFEQPNEPHTFIVHINKLECNKEGCGDLRVSLLTSNTKYGEQANLEFKPIVVGRFDLDRLANNRYYKDIKKTIKAECK